MRTAIVGTEVGDGSLPDEGGIEDLYLRTVPSAVRLAFLITGDAHLAEDVGQEAFLRATGRFAHLRSPSTFDAYLRRAVVNLCMSHLRRRKVERAYLEREGRRAATSVDPPDLGERDELRAALERDAERAPLVTQAPPDVRRRVRRRQVGTGLVATATAAAAVAGAMLVAASLLRSTARPGEESPDRTRTSTVRGVTLEYPAGWTLVELADEVVVSEGRAGPEGSISGQALLQLSNFDPMASEGSLLCPDPAWGPLPDGGVLLYVQALEYPRVPGSTPPSWPVEPGGPLTDAFWPCERAVQHYATWTVDGQVYEAFLVGDAGPALDRLAEIFRSMTPRPEGIDRDEVLSADGTPIDGPFYVLDSWVAEGQSWNLLAYASGYPLVPGRICIDVEVGGRMLGGLCDLDVAAMQEAGGDVLGFESDLARVRSPGADLLYAWGATSIAVDEVTPVLDRGSALVVSRASLPPSFDARLDAVLVIRTADSHGLIRTIVDGETVGASRFNADAAQGPAPTG